TCALPIWVILELLDLPRGILGQLLEGVELLLLLGSRRHLLLDGLALRVPDLRELLLDVVQHGAPACARPVDRGHRAGRAGAGRSSNRPRRGGHRTWPTGARRRRDRGRPGCRPSGSIGSVSPWAGVDVCYHP